MDSSTLFDCEHCKQSFKPTSKRHRFCSVECRMEAKNVPLAPLDCQQCKQSFQPTNKRQRFCSGKCRATAYYIPIKQSNAKRKLKRFQDRNRAKSLGFDGRYGGPTNSTADKRAAAKTKGEQ
jgi:hypothetical protein